MLRDLEFVIKELERELKYRTEIEQKGERL